MLWTLASSSCKGSQLTVLADGRVILRCLLLPTARLESAQKLLSDFEVLAAYCDRHLELGTCRNRPEIHTCCCPRLGFARAACAQLLLSEYSIHWSAFHAVTRLTIPIEVLNQSTERCQRSSCLLSVQSLTAGAHRHTRAACWLPKFERLEPDHHSAQSQGAAVALQFTSRQRASACPCAYLAVIRRCCRP